MDHADGVRLESGKRVYRTVVEKRRIVELTLQAGASVAKVALAEGVNSHQVFDWDWFLTIGRWDHRFLGYAGR